MKDHPHAIFSGPGTPGSREDEAPRSRWRRFLRWGPGAAILIIMIVVVVRHFGEGKEFVALLRQAHPFWLLMALALQAGTYACVGAVWKVALAEAGARLSLGTLAKLSLIKLAFDQLIPTGGLSGTIAVVQRLDDMEVEPAGITRAIVVNVVTRYGAYAIAVISALAILWISHELSQGVLVGATVLIGLAIAIPLGLLIWIRHFHGRFPGHLRRIPELADLLQETPGVLAGLLRNPRLLVVCLCLNLCIFILDSATLGTMLLALGRQPDPFNVFLALVLASVAATVGFVPGGLGTFEATCVATLTLHDTPVEAALTATLLFRGFTFWLPMFGGMLLARREPKDP